MTQPSDLPFSQSCENNKQPILAQLETLLADKRHVLEIAGGTGQHAEYFASALPHIRWQSSDIPDNVASLNTRLSLAAADNLPPALALVADCQLHDRLGKNAAINAGPFDALFSANSLHIMSAGSVTNFFLGAGKMLAEGALLIVYGPFNYQGKFTSPSNEEFDGWLKERNPVSGIRDFETVCSIADITNFELAHDIDMPANNRLLVWQKQAAE